MRSSEKLRFCYCEPFYIPVIEFLPFRHCEERSDEAISPIALDITPSFNKKFVLSSIY